jgi:DNA-binding CsgD family transcriptional regulator/tetratricopeptide (TPR) repeat protein
VCHNPPVENWPLVGRGEEVAYVLQTIDDPAHRGVYLAGAAGVGKTRLLSEVTAALGDFCVERATGTHSAQPLPFGALTHLLADGVTGDAVDVLARVGASLRRRGGDRPVVLVVDDAHLLDPTSAAFVHYAATTGQAKVLISVRSGEVAPDAVTALYRDGVVPRLELQPISRPEFDTLIVAVLAAPVEDRTLDRLWDAAAGNVMFVRELILDATEAGTLRQQGGSWRWGGSAGAAPRLREIVLHRIGQLSDAQRHLLNLLAVAEPLSVALIDRLAPTASIDDAERRGLVAVETTGNRVEVRLGHPLFGDALRPALSTIGLRGIYHDLAVGLAATGVRRRDDILRLALWRLEAGDPADSQLLADAARIANNHADPALAERLARAAATQGATFGAALELGRALFAQRRFAEAEAILQPLSSIEALSDAEMIELADARVLAVGHGLGRIDDAITILVEAERRVTDPEVRALLQAHRAAMLAFAARFGEAAAVGQAALEVIRDDATRVRSISSVGISLIMAGQLDRALQLSDELLPIAWQMRDQLPRAPFWVTQNRVTALLFAGRFDEALALFDLVVAAVPHLDDLSRATAGMYRGRIALAQGRPATAQRLLADALAAPTDGNLGGLARWCTALHAEARALLGNRADSDTLESGPGTADGGHPAYEADALRAQAWVGAIAGRTSEATDRMIDAAELARSRGQAIFELLALHDAIRLGSRDAAVRCDELAPTIDGSWANAIGLHAAAVLAEDPARYETAAAAFEAMGADLVAAELLAVASTHYDRSGLRARATDTNRRSHLLNERCEGARTPLLRWMTDPIPLSRREREVATLASQSLSNAQISETLHISVRTVESHLHSAYTKLGVTQREDLAGLLG